MIPSMIGKISSINNTSLAIYTLNITTLSSNNINMKLHSQSLPSNTRLLASGETSYITSVEQSLITSKRLNTFFYSAISKATTERPLKPAESSSTGPIPLNISFAIMNHPFFNSRYKNLKEVNPLSKQWNMRNLSPIYLFFFLVAHF